VRQPAAAPRPPTASSEATLSPTFDFAATAAARKVHGELMSTVASFAATTQGRDRLRRLPFLPDAASAQAMACKVMEAKAVVAPLDRERVRSLLGRLAPVPDPPARQVAGRLVACESEEIRAAWERRGLHRFARLCGPEGLRQADGYDLVVCLYEDGVDVSGDSLVELPASAPIEEVAPESALAWLEAHREALGAAATLAQTFAKPTCANEALLILEESRRAHTTPKALRRQVEDVRREVDALVRERTAGLTVSGTDVLQSLGGRLPQAVQAAVDQALAEGARRLQERTGCSFQPYVAGSPVQVDDDEVEAVELQLEARGHVDTFLRLGRAAKALAALRPRLETELAAWREFELAFTLGCLAHHYDLHPARFGPGLRFEASVHLDLAGPDKAHAQRIAYRLGEGEPVALLTGANSGGKTTLLEHILQVVLMARMGLPVVGEGVEVPWVDEVHYVTARRSLDAGAFESFLKAFLPVSLGDRRRLVLADEVEAVTEAEAAARILGCFLDRLHASGSLAVVVSHMAPRILAHTGAPVRVDGIEATGLDSRNRLVVDRNPRLGRLARSTPELIVQRLAATAKGPARELYADLLSRFQAATPDPAPASTRVRRRPAKGSRTPAGDMHK